MYQPKAKATAVLLAATFAVAALAGCMVQPDQDEDSSSEAGYGTVAFFVKDAPADELSEFYVTFSKVEVHQAGGDEAEDEGNETDDDSTPSGNESAPAGNESAPAGNESAPAGNESAPGGNESAPEGNETAEDDESSESRADSSWIVIVNQTHTVNLKNFTGDARAFLGNASVPAGTYTQIRIHVDEAWGILADNGSRVEVMVPSDALKIVRPWTVAADEATELTVDFILEDSLIKAGQSGKWIFKPVMKLAVDHVGGDDGAADAGSDRGNATGNQSQADDAPGGPPGNQTGGPPENPGSQGRA